MGMSKQRKQGAQHDQGTPPTEQGQPAQASVAVPASGWAHRAAARAAERGGYMAGLLVTYREVQGMGERELAEELGCSAERLPLLGLCRQPRRDGARFAAEVRELAAFAGADAGRLAHVVRAVDATRAMGQREGAAGAGYLAAARDAAGEPEEPDALVDQQGGVSSGPAGADTPASERGADGSPA